LASVKPELSQPAYPELLEEAAEDEALVAELSLRNIRSR
jgi:hypothetical protein